MILNTRTSHVATAAIAVIGTIVALRAPWTAQASGNSNAALTQPQAVVYVDQYGRPLQAVAPGAPVPTFAPVPAPVQMAVAPVARPVPAAYAPVAYESPAVETAPAIRPAVIRSAPAPQRVSTVEKKSSWKKQAVIIGGSAGTGAGVGALIGGKKGAAIGAAIGGGSAALWQALKK